MGPETDRHADWIAKCLCITEEKPMPLVNLVIVLIIVGVALYLINRYIPMASAIKSILNVVVVVGVCVWLLQATGMWGSVSSFKVGR
jgi:predicted membrane protein